MSELAGRSVLLIVSGGIAAYKALELVRLLVGDGVRVRGVLTAGGAQFVTALSLQALSGQTVSSELFSMTEESEMGHIALSRAADLVVVAPASANMIATMAAGLSPDLASTLLLATDKPVLIAPAMNVRMWEHPATVANMAVLRGRGVHVVGPDEGIMACHEFGFGRLAEPPAILEAIRRLLIAPAGDRPLDGRRALVTAGPTIEPIDPVRFITNRSSGRQGYEIARALARLGASVTLVTGPVTLPKPDGMDVVAVETADAMLAACETVGRVDVAVFTAAVADWRLRDRSDRKIKKQPGVPPSLDLVVNPDILQTIARRGPSRPRLVVGFAAETHDVLAHASEKRERKGCDWMVANDARPETGNMGGPTNEVHLITKDGVEDWPRMDKETVARHLAERIAAALGASS